MCMLRDVIETGPSVRTVRPDATVSEVVREMCKWNVRAVLVGDAVDPLGIICERDVLERVVIPHLDPQTTSVASVMTTPVVWLPATSSAEDALSYMHANGVHQVPVSGEESFIGLVSCSDLETWALRSKDSEITALMSYVMGH